MHLRGPLALAGSLLLTLSAATAQTVVINELKFDAPGGDNGQVFVELYGPAGTDVSGWTVTSVEGSGSSAGNCNSASATFPPGTAIPGDGFLVLADDDGTGATAVANADVILNFDPENGGFGPGTGGDSVILVDDGGFLVDAVAYGTIDNTAVGTCNAGGWFEGNPARDVFAPLSIERCPAGSDTGDNDNDFTPTAPTPGFGQLCCNALEYMSLGSGNSISVSGGESVGLDVWHSCSPNLSYLILWSATDPGSPLVPVVLDPLTDVAAGFVNIAPFVGWFGTLDANGRVLGTAALDFSGGFPSPAIQFDTWVGSVALSFTGLQFTNNAMITVEP